MSELTKKQRAQNVLNELLDLMPPLLRNMAPVFLTSYQSQFEELTDEQIDAVLDHFQKKLDYIRGE